MLIAGGGIIGATLASALGTAGVSCAVVEAADGSRTECAERDSRAIALALGSRRILEGLDIWPALDEHASPIRRIHVSDRGHFGITRLCAADHGVPAFGYVSDARRIARAIAATRAGDPHVEWLRAARVVGVRVEDKRVVASVACDGTRRQIRARLLVGADGGDSTIRKLLGIGENARDYAQCAITCNVTPALDHGDTAFERFTSSGPLALLPMRDGRCAVIWTVQAGEADAVLALGDAEFLDALGHRFGSRLGRLGEVGTRVRHGLKLIRSSGSVRPRAAIIGNAAHTLHPIAGQGVNLGLRDVAALAEVVVDSVRRGGDPGSRAMLDDYARWRAPDQGTVTRFTDSLVWLFSNRVGPLVAGRNLGLVALEAMPRLQRVLVNRAMGLAGRQTRLARGLPL